MQQQQHIQAIKKNGKIELKPGLRLRFVVFGFESVCFIVFCF